ncbi:unnamed protein product, partial [Closterium sp. NIES-54]
MRASPLPPYRPPPTFNPPHHSLSHASLYWATKWVADRYDNHLMRANAWHHRSDSVSSFAALLGVATLCLPLLLCWASVGGVGIVSEGVEEGEWSRG